MPLSAEETIGRVLDALAREIRRHHGHIGEIEARLGKSRGYLSKVCAREWQISLDVLMSALEAMDVEPDAFFGAALDVAPSTDRFLEDVSRDGSDDPGIDAIEDVARQLEHGSGSRGDA